MSIGSLEGRGFEGFQSGGTPLGSSQLRPHFDPFFCPLKLAALKETAENYQRGRSDIDSDIRSLFQTDRTLNHVQLELVEHGGLEELYDSIAGEASAYKEAQKDVLSGLKDKEEFLDEIREVISSITSSSSFLILMSDKRVIVVSKSPTTDKWMVKSAHEKDEEIDVLELLSQGEHYLIGITKVCFAPVEMRYTSREITDTNDKGEFKCVKYSFGMDQGGPPFYQEIQYEGLCGKHAINNCLGQHRYDVKDLMGGVKEPNRVHGSYAEGLHPRFLREALFKDALVIKITEENKEDVSNILASADRFTIKDDKHVWACRKDVDTGEWWLVESSGVVKKGYAEQRVINVHDLPTPVTLIIPRSQEETLSDISASINELDLLKDTPVVLEERVSIEEGEKTSFFERKVFLGELRKFEKAFAHFLSSREDLLLELRELQKSYESFTPSDYSGGEPDLLQATVRFVGNIRKEIQDCTFSRLDRA